MNSVSKLLAVNHLEIVLKDFWMGKIASMDNIESEVIVPKDSVYPIQFVVMIITNALKISLILIMIQCVDMFRELAKNVLRVTLA